MDPLFIILIQYNNNIFCVHKIFIPIKLSFFLLFTHEMKHRLTRTFLMSVFNCFSFSNNLFALIFSCVTEFSSNFPLFYYYLILFSRKILFNNFYFLIYFKKTVSCTDLTTLILARQCRNPN